MRTLNPLERLPRSLLAGLAVIVMVGVTWPGWTQEPSDTDAIRQTALDYIEGWYAGDADRMREALHPSLAKRMVFDDRSGASRLNDQTADILVGATASGAGTRTDAASRRSDVTILDVFQNAAVVRVDATSWVDYLQIVRWNGEWKIINVLWELRAEEGDSDR